MTKHHYFKLPKYLLGCSRKHSNLKKNHILLFPFLGYISAVLSSPVYYCGPLPEQRLVIKPNSVLSGIFKLEPPPEFISNFPTSIHNLCIWESPMGLFVRTCIKLSKDAPNPFFLMEIIVLTWLIIISSLFYFRQRYAGRRVISSQETKNNLYFINTANNICPLFVSDTSLLLLLFFL